MSVSIRNNRLSTLLDKIPPYISATTDAILYYSRWFLLITIIGCSGNLLWHWQFLSVRVLDAIFTHSVRIALLN